MTVKIGQVYKSKDSGKLIKIVRKKSGNKHWTTHEGHNIHEGTLTKYYELNTPTKGSE